MFYADAFDFADPPQGHFIRGDKTALGEVFRPIANKNPNNGQGLHTLEATEYLGDQNAGLILWRWRVRGARTFLGLAVGERDVQATGMSYHVYQHGKIVREIVYSDQLCVARQIGLPLSVAAPQDSRRSAPPDRGLCH